MNEELVFKGKDGNVLTDSIRVAKAFSKEHRRVMQDIRELYCSQEFRLHNFVQSSYFNNQKKEQPMYIMTQDGFTFLAMGYNGEKASEFKEKYINQFNDMKKQIEEERKNNFSIPQTYSEALYLAANQAKQIEEQQKQLEVMQPKADFFDAVADSKTAVPMNDVAKTLAIKGMGRNKLFEFLRDNKILMNNNRPYQKYVDANYFRVIEQHFQKDGEECINFKTLVYQRGIDYIRKIVLNNKNSLVVLK